MISLNKRYKMTAEVEKRFIELGGYDPNRTLSEKELSDALCKAINMLAEHGKFNILEKIYLSAVKHGDLPG